MEMEIDLSHVTLTVSMFIHLKIPYEISYRQGPSFRGFLDNLTDNCATTKELETFLKNVYFFRSIEF